MKCSDISDEEFDRLMEKVTSMTEEEMKKFVQQGIEEGMLDNLIEERKREEEEIANSDCPELERLNRNIKFTLKLSRDLDEDRRRRKMK